MIKLLVIADDFTGALDTGVQFSKKGVPTLVTTDRHVCFQTIGSEIEVLVIDIESRHSSLRQAYDSVARIAKAAINSGVVYFYKKTDSTLRGNIGAELTALLDAYGGNQLAFIPAFPKSSRTTKNGIQYVGDIELNKTEFSHDPFEPVKHSSVDQIIRQQSDVETESITVDRYLDAGKEYTKKTICVFDAQTDEDMQLLGAELKKANRLNILAGCAGFAEILPELLELRTAEMKWDGNRDNILIVSGSVNQIAIDQMDYAKKHGYWAVTLSPKQKLKNITDSDNCTELVESVVHQLKQHKKVIVESISTREQICVTEQYARDNGIPLNDLHFQITQNIGELVKKILERTVVGNLVVFGGDTLYGIMDKIPCDGILPVAEIAPGIVAAKVISKTREFCIITKAGGFGRKNVVGVIDEFVFKQ